MRTAVDSSVLLAIFNDEPGAQSWMEALMQARREGLLVVCDVVYGEVAPAFTAQVELDEALRQLGVSFEAVSPSAAWRAGQAYREYRDAGGPRNHLMPDFLIAAHAQTQADRLAAIDRGYLRRYFSGLPLVQP